METSLLKLREKLITYDVFENEEKVKEWALQLREQALYFARFNYAPDWMLEDIHRCSSPDAILSSLRHIEGGQKYILEKMLLDRPALSWYRGGSLTTLAGQFGCRPRHFTDQQLDQYIIDSEAHGVLERPELALAFLNVTPRGTPVLYHIQAESFLEGLETRAIQLAGQHGYDLKVLNKDRQKYLEFCQKHLTIYKVTQSSQ